MKHLALCASAWLFFTNFAGADVKILGAPHGGEVPDVVLDGQGVLHMTYGSGLPGDGFYVRSADLGKSFSKPVKLNRQANTVTTGMERGPKIALGKDGTIHVVWLGYYKTGGGAWHARSIDGGITFDPEQNLAAPKYGVDNAAVAADDQGQVIVAWTGGFPGVKEDSESPTASPIILSRSTDQGKTFGKNYLLKSDHPASAKACGCCRLEARFGKDDQLFIAFRGGYKNLRDPYLVKGPVADNDFQCLKISPDEWDSGCPMQGIPFQLDSQGKVLVSWMCRDRAYWSFSEDGGKTFSKKIAAPASRQAQELPMALANSKGEVCLIWKQGQEAHWAIHDRGGKLRSTQAVKGAKTRNRPTAFVDAADNFWIVLGN